MFFFSNDVEEVIYSQGEPYPEKLYANRSWDSDDNFTYDNEPTHYMEVIL